MSYLTGQRVNHAARIGRPVIMRYIVELDDDSDGGATSKIYEGTSLTKAMAAFCETVTKEIGEVQHPEVRHEYLRDMEQLWIGSEVTGKNVALLMMYE